MGTTTHTITMVLETCCHAGCGVVFGLEQEYRKERFEQKDDFFCPNGHAQRYLGKSYAERAQEAENALMRERAAHDQTAAARDEARGKAARAERRVARMRRGVCPFCKRTFANVAAHMKCKHSRKKNQ